MVEQKRSAEFTQSIYDAAPAHIRSRVANARSGEEYNALFMWFYSCSSDPRPPDQRFSVPRAYFKLPAFPWENPMDAFMRMFEQG
jgi:hypothetical protein